ncbi:MAG TPA: nucleotidyltransferase domain-containing protein [Polyangiales bacterium]
MDALASQLDARVVQGLWIFGSRASDGARPESDLDLGVLCTPELGVERFAIEDRVARALNLEVDLIDMASCDPILAWEIITTGRLLHEPDERAVEHFMREARFRAEDADQRNRMILLATGARR